MTSVLIAVTFVLTIAFAVSAVMRRASAASRHVVWTCAFASVLLVAPLRWRLPQRVYTSTLPVVATAPVFVSSPPQSSRVPPDAVLMFLWAAGALAAAIRLVRNAVRLRSIIRSARGARPILQTPLIGGPLVTGLFRPVILLPAESASWTFARRRAVIAHEAAHIRRHDPLILFAAHIATALYWFHPLVWIAASRLRAESERACDDAALKLGLLPSGYAGHLLDLARKFEPQLAIPMASTSHLESRVKSILDPRTNRSFAARTTWVAALAITAALLAPLTSISLHAQSASGVSGITGSVTDPSGAVVPNATVKATNLDLNTTDTAYSRADGSYSFTNLAPGHYAVSVLQPGFRIFRIENLNVPAGETVQLRARLAIGSISEAVTVAAQGIPKPDQTPSAAPKPIRVGGNVQAANLVRQPKPVYPPDLKAQGVQGTVTLQAVIAKDGTIQSLSSISGAVNQGLVTAAMDAVSQWRYKPTLLNGEPVEVTTNIDINFTLSQ